METPVVRSRGRPRKRRREEDSPIGKSLGANNGNGDVEKTGGSRRRGRPPKKRVVEMRGEAMVGRYVLKEFDGSGVFLGKIVSCDSGLYRVDYEDGDCEDLDSDELREFVVGDERERFVGELLERRKKLDEAIIEKNGGKEVNDGSVKFVMVKDDTEVVVVVEVEDEPAKVDTVEVVSGLDMVDVTQSNERMDGEDAVNVVSDSGTVEVSTLSNVPCEDAKPSDIKGSDDEVIDGNYCLEDEDNDSSSDYCEYGQGWETRADTEIPVIPPPELPPSSGTVGVPEEYVSHLFSVHGFLRTFSVRLFLSPFTLDDLVGCLKCTTPNTLLDAIHVALLRTLKRHLDRLDSEGSELASKCLRSIDWGLLDNLTWPVYLVHYFMVMGNLNEPEWKGFYVDVLEKQYCALSIEIKLTVLQILCDDALDTVELRSEIDTREESEVGVDSDGVLSTPVHRVPRQAYPRCSKTSADKDSDRPNLDAENSVLFCSKTVKSDGHNRDTEDVIEDANGDECRLCGMEGMLICCDGCPSAYHSRCIGVNKLSIPDGEWFCPECTISRIGPPINKGTLLRGAEVFGIDSYAQLFLGTCDHLLLLKVSLKASSIVRYYNRKDVPKVVSVISSSPYHSVSYLEICQKICGYWGLPQAVVSPILVNQATMALDYEVDYKLLPLQSHISHENRNEKVLYDVGNETYANSVGESSIYGAVGLGNEPFLKFASDDITLGAPIQSDPRSMPYSTVASVRQNATDESSMLSEQAEFYRAKQGLTNQPTMAGITSWPSGYADSVVAGHSNGVCLPESHYMQVRENKSKVSGRLSHKKKDTCSYMGSVFKPHAYINSYVHGAFAATAAANFAALSSDENQASEVHASDPRKAMAANISLQVKAFFSAAVRFFWPSAEKKLVEIPRERCSWCLHCKATVISKKSCLLNQAALSATRAEMKFISGLRLEKLSEGSLYGIIAYTLYMEESFRGLIHGPFRSSSYREQWRKKVEQASSCCEIKALLLDLERNLCSIALSSEWTNLVNTWMDESSVPQTAAAAGSVQKRVAGKRKKYLATPEEVDDDPIDSNEFIWWRGGKLAKLVFQRETFPRQILRKAVRQGGSRTLPGIYYANSSDVPKRSRQFIWRAAVEMAKNASQLALQVRYLDQNLKWSDLVRTEQNSVDGKGPETEAFAFRNAHICDKKILEHKTMYGVVFEHQKHLSSRLMKSIIDKEESKDGKVIYWLLEARIPLYLVKEYEEKAEMTDILPPIKPDRYSKHQKRQLKASRKDVFVYLSLKRDDLHVCPCASCHRDVLLELAVTCNSCEGYCHNTCILSSTEQTNEDMKSTATCKQCSHQKSLSLIDNSVESPTSPLTMQGQDGLAEKKPASSDSKSRKNKNSKSKPSRSRTRPSLLEGLVWKKKKKGSDDGTDFRRRNVILRGSSDGLTLSPQCRLCQKPYSPLLMYIRCYQCEKWFHADAVKLDESKLSDLVGFKCCRCRRMKSLSCPYADVVPKTETRKLHIKGPKQDTVETNSVSEAISEEAGSLPSTLMSLMEMEDDVFIDMDDPLSFPVSQAEQTPGPKSEVKSEVNFEWANFGAGQQKLQIKRQVKSEQDDDGLSFCDPASAETKSFPNPNIEWEICNGGLEDGTALNFNNLNYDGDFEPQTYFSFTELLEIDGGNQLGGVDASPSGVAWDDFPCEYPQNGFMEQFNASSFDELMPTEASTEPVVGARCCEVCHVATPAPDRACQICGSQIHSHCAPCEDVSQGGSWVCGQCREWS
ncbi:hypothetical protein vseg_001522 [Gypsophila vaccaria]